MKKKLMFLINPAAGKSGYRNGLGEVLENFCSNGYLPTIFMTSGPGDATNIVAEHGKDFDLIVCLGGDGTLSETVSGIMRLSSRIPLGYIPTGTANDVAATLNLPTRPPKAAMRIINGKPMPLDVGHFGSYDFFSYIAAFGAFTQVSYETPQNIKNILGHLAYVFTGMLQLPNIAPIRVRVEYDDGVIEDDLIFGGVTNSMSIAGMIRIKEGIVELGDGLFEVILVHHPRDIWDANKTVADILWQKYDTSNVTLLKSKSVRFIFDDPVAWTRDGENGGLHKELLLTNHHGAINFIL